MSASAVISTTVPINLGVLGEMNSMLQEFIEIGYSVQVIGTSVNKKGEVFITLRGEDSNIRFYIKEEFNVEGEAADKYIAKTREGDVPFWSLSIFSSYMTDKRGWSRSESLSEGDNPEKAVNIRLTKYVSPTQGVAIFLNRCFRNEPESVVVFSMDLDNDENADETQYVGEINYRHVLSDAEERVGQFLSDE